ncbi:MAG: MFS transporter [Actinomycetales bacterium]|nr:MFS transporter [Actinomycetales bacterium]
MEQYWAFLRIPGVPRLLFASIFGRLAYSMVSLAIFFQVQRVTGSVAVAGLAAGVSSGLGAMTAGPRGLLVDRLGQTRPLVALVPAYAVSCTLLAFVAHDAVTCVLLAALVGGTAPPFNVSIRPLWRDIVGDDRVRMAYSVDSACQNLLILIGPVVASLIALNVTPRAALLTVGISMLLGGLLLVMNPHSRAWVPEAREHGEAGLLRSPAIRLLALEGAAMGLSAGFITIGIPTLATLSGEEGLAGPVLSAMGVGAIIGSLWAGAKARDIAPARGLRASTLLFAIALIPLALVPIGPAMMAVVLVAWVFIGPANVFYLEVIDVVRPRGTAVAALGSLWMIEGLGMAAGNAIGGVLAESTSPHLTLALGSLFAIASPIIFSIGIRGVLKPAAQATAKDALEAAA